MSNAIPEFIKSNIVFTGDTLLLYLLSLIIFIHNNSLEGNFLLKGFSYKEISLLLEIPSSTIEYKYRVFRQKIKVKIISKNEMFFNRIIR